MALVLGARALCAAEPAPAADQRAQIYPAVAAATKFLLAQIGDDGRCVREFPPENPRFGGKTGLCVYALATAGLDAKHPTVRRALAWLTKAKLTGTYAVAARAGALAALGDKKLLDALKSDVRWLVNAAANDGSYTYTSAGGKAPEAFDNSNAQMAVTAVWEGANRGIKIPRVYWQRIEEYWIGQQAPDGGWGYFARPNAVRAKTYGSMTAAGLATMYICFDNLRRDRFLRCLRSEIYKPIASGLTWMGRNFSVRRNPRLGPNWYYYWLYCLARVGLASGRRHFGGHDWYAEGAAELLDTQKPDGSWGSGDHEVHTAFALLFLARGRHPVLVNKLRFKGNWNPRPRDCANLARWISFTYEQPVNWQIIDPDSPLRQMHDAPILYVSGAGPVTFRARDLAALRTFVNQGGLILSEAACNSADFTLSMQRAYKKMFPRYPLGRLGPTHPVYSIQFPIRQIKGLAGVSNGVRLLAIHSPGELSLGLQLGPTAVNRPTFELLANIYLLATDKGVLRPRGTGGWPAAGKFTPAATVRVMRVRHNANYDPEPLAWKRLAILMARQHRIALEVAGPTEITRLDAAKWPVAAMTGTGKLVLTGDQKTALKGFFAAGGTLIVDAAGGDREFATSAERQIFPLVPNGDTGVLASRHPIYRGPIPIRRVSYRRDLALALGAGRTQPRLRGVASGDRLAVIFSPEDLTAGLLGFPYSGIRGYSPASAVRLMTNILCYAGKAKLAAAPAN